MSNVIAFPARPKPILEDAAYIRLAMRWTPNQGRPTPLPVHNELIIKVGSEAHGAFCRLQDLGYMERSKDDLDANGHLVVRATLKGALSVGTVTPLHCPGRRARS